MENKKNNIMVTIIIVLMAIICGLITFMIINTLDNEANNSSENKENLQCNYEKLKNASELTETEKNDIIMNSTEYIISPADYEIKSINKYTYGLKFYVQDSDRNQPLYTYLWRENEVWKNSDYFDSEKELLENKLSICQTCGDC